jgi:myo-inositol-1(or 4)-monophosphatase
VDPLDGTKEYIAGLPEYAVSIALVEHGRPVLGVVWQPDSETGCHAIRGAGAYGGAGVLKVREGRSLLASRTELARDEFGPFADEWSIAASGSIALKLARVAAGEAALTLSRGPKGEWDVCAGALLVEEAGGIVTDAHGMPFAFNGLTGFVGGILAGAPGAWRRGLERVNALGLVRLRKDDGLA